MHFNLPKLPTLLIRNYILPILAICAIMALAAYTVYQQIYIKQNIEKLSTEFSKVKKTQEDFSQNFAEDLFNDHLLVSGEINTEQNLASLQSEIEQLKSSDSETTISEIYKLYADFQTKIKRNSDSKLDTASAMENLNNWGQQLLGGELDIVKSSITDQISQLDASYQKYIDSLPKPLAPASVAGYSYTTVNTEKGKFGVSLFKFAMSDVKVKTVSANSENCKDNCPTKSLETYVKENGGFAGINGTYFCPPDYSSCSGKVNSFDYAFYNSSHNKWLNKSALTWSKTGLMTFNGTSVKFYRKSSDYGGGGVTAGISNYPSLLEDGNYVVRLEDLTSYQKDVRGPKGFIGIGGSNIYVGIVYGATVPEAAYAVRALGVKDALNIDGGGSSAMYINGGYVVGPGRSLPNAIVLTR